MERLWGHFEEALVAGPAFLPEQQQDQLSFRAPKSDHSSVDSTCCDFSLKQRKSTLAHRAGEDVAECWYLQQLDALQGAQRQGSQNVQQPLSCITGSHQAHAQALCRRMEDCCLFPL